MIRLDVIVPLILWNNCDEFLPDFGPELASAAAIEPIKLDLRHEEDTAQNDIAHRLWMGLGINQRKCRTPAAAKHDPLRNTQRFANQLNIGNKVPCSIICTGGMRRGTATSTLIKQDNSKDCGVEITPHRRAAPATGTTMQDNYRYTVRVAALLYIDVMPLAHGQHPPIERANRGVQILHCALLIVGLIH